LTYAERKEKEKYLLYLIKHNRLTSIEKVANDFGCSTRTIKRMLCDLKNEGHKIVYCYNTKRYFLENLAE